MTALLHPGPRRSFLLTALLLLTQLAALGHEHVHAFAQPAGAQSVSAATASAPGVVAARATGRHASAMRPSAETCALCLLLQRSSATATAGLPGDFAPALAGILGGVSAFALRIAPAGGSATRGPPSA